MRLKVKFSAAVGVFICMLMLICMPKQIKAAVLDDYQDGKIYDVTKYGADPSGKKSSDDAVQEAILAARLDTHRGDLGEKKRTVLYFPAGQYTVQSSIRPIERMVVAAEDAAVVTCTKAAAIRGYHDADHVIIEGGTWISSAEDFVIGMTDSENFTIKNVVIRSGKVGVAVFSSMGTLENVSVSKSKGIGVQISTGSKVNASKCSITNNGYSYPKKGYLGQGIGVYGGASLTITDSKINKNRECAVSLADKGSSLNAKNCELNDNGRHAIGTSRPCKVVMKNCDMYRNGIKDNLDGVSLVDGSKGILTNCTIANSGVTGVLVVNSSSATMKNCTFKGNGAHNIYGENS